MTRQLKAGVIGVGHLGRHHARIYHEMPDLQLVGISDLDAHRMKEYSEKYQCRAYDNFTELLQDVDLVSIAVPTTDHFKIARECLKHKIHVLVEKPITSTVEEGRQLIKMANENNCALMVGQSERFNPAVAAATNIVDTPKFIEVHRLGPFSTRATDVDVILDLMIHDVDLILSWVDSDIKMIRAAGVEVLSERIDIANARLEFESGCTANITASRISMKATRKVRVFQPSCYLSIDCMKHQVACYKKSGSGAVSANPMDQIQFVPVSVKPAEPLVSELTSFVDAVRSDSTPPVTGEAGLQALKVCREIISTVRG